MPDLPSFLPAQAPVTPILDLSNSLDATSLEALNHVAANVGYSPKVVILPRNYTCPDARQLTLDLADHWGVNGDGKTLLLVVDLKGHQVRAHGSPELNKAGITSDYITNSLIPHQFVPYMRKGDLASAIRLTMLQVDEVQRAKAQESDALPQATGYNAAEIAGTAAYQAAHSYSYPSSTNSAPVLSFPIFPLLGILAAGACAMLLGHRYIELIENKNQYGELRIRMDSLFSKTDKVAQAADFLDTKSYADLCHEIADYFAKISTLQNAQAQVEALLKQGVRSNGPAWRAITRCRQYVGAMEIMATDLLHRVEAATGTKHSYEPNGNIEVAAAPAPAASPVKVQVAANNNSPKINAGFRPRWTSDPIYARTVDEDPLQSISTYVVMKERESIPVGVYQNSSDWFSRGSSSGGGSWTSSGGGSSWSSDSSSSSSSDGGGSWDSSSSSSDSGSSSDGGGSW